MALDIKQAKRIEARVHTRNRNGKNTLESVKIYIFDCCGDCGGEIRPTKQTLNTHSGYCVRCVKRKPENKYRTIYNRLLYNAKREGWQCDVSYEDFCFFTNIKVCNYCGREVIWNEWKPGPYNLDRKDTTQGYTLDNLAICCFDCNFKKNKFWTFEEFKLIMESINAWNRLDELGKKELMFVLIEAGQKGLP